MTLERWASISTIGLAIGTVVLALVSLKAANATKREAEHSGRLAETATLAYRPVLSVSNLDTRIRDKVPYAVLRLRNIGGGPAIRCLAAIRFHVEPETAESPEIPDSYLLTEPNDISLETAEAGSGNVSLAYDPALKRTSRPEWFGGPDVAAVIFCSDLTGRRFRFRVVDRTVLVPEIVDPGDPRTLDVDSWTGDPTLWISDYVERPQAVAQGRSRWRKMRNLGN
jgi:hypothetical protein